MSDTVEAVKDERFERCKDFALRMVDLCEENGEPTREWVRNQVDHFIWVVEGEIRGGDTITDWDGSKDGICLCDLDSELMYECMPSFRWDDNGELREDEDEQKMEYEWEEKHWSPVSCAIRAGVDLAYSPSAGVVGYTVGDLRQMYPEGIPTWITEQYPEADWATVSDDTGIWL